MNRWKARLRGLLGLTAIGGTAGAVLGGAWAALNTWFGWGSIFAPLVLSDAVMWGLFGALTSAGFGVVLTIVGTRRSLEELHSWRAGVWGLLLGAMIPLGAISVLTGKLPLTLAVLPFAAFTGGLGALLTSGLLAMAKSAPQFPLGSPSETPALQPGSEEDRSTDVGAA